MQEANTDIDSRVLKYNRAKILCQCFDNKMQMLEPPPTPLARI